MMTEPLFIWRTLAISSVHCHSTKGDDPQQEGQERRQRQQEMRKNIWEHLIDPSEKHNKGKDKSKLQELVDDNYEDMEMEDLQEIYESLTCIRILDGQDDGDDDTFLKVAGGQLVDIQPQILE